MSESGSIQNQELFPNRKSPARTDLSNRARRGKFRILFGSLVGFGFLVYFLPAILVNTPLKQTAIDYVLADFKGSAQVSKVSAGWFSSIQMQHVTLRDNEGNDVLTIGSIRTSQTLAGMLFSSDYGTIEIDRLAIDLKVRNGGSNLEDAFAAYLSPPATDSAQLIPVINLKISNGVARLRSESIDQQHILDNIECSIQTMSDEAPLSVNLNCRGLSADNTNGQIAIALAVDSGQSELVGNSIQAEVQFQDFPVEVLAPILTRFLGPTNCAGHIAGNFSLTVNCRESAATLNIDALHGRQLALVASDWIGSDQFSAMELTANGDVQLAPGKITANGFKLESEFARIHANGQFDLEQLSQLADGGEIPQTGFQLDSTVDIAKIANMLPETTRLRDQVRLNSGVVQIQASTRDENGTPRLVVNADAANMNFAVNGQSVQWQRPVRFVAVAQRQGGRVRLENIQLQSEFLTASGQAGMDQGQLQISGDLNRTVSQLKQVLDLGGLQLAGKMQGNLGWRTAVESTTSVSASADTNSIRFNGQFKLENPALQYPGYKLWEANQLDLAITGDAVVSNSGAMAIDAARIDVAVGNENAFGVLHERIDNLYAARKFQFQCEVTGSIAKWISHARNFASIPEFFADGSLASQFMLTLNPKSCRLNQLRMEATDFVFNGFGLGIREPTMDGKMSVKYVYEDSSVQFTKATISSSTIAASTEQLKFDPRTNILADGEVVFRANVNRASNWYGYSLPGDTVRWDGSAVGAMKFSSEPGMFGGDLKIEISDLIFVQPDSETRPLTGVQSVSSRQSYSESWREPTVTFSSSIYLSDDFNAVQLRGLNLNSKLADVEGRGSINDLAQTMSADLSGRWNVKWENINQLMRDLSGDSITFEGNGWQPFEIKGPVFDPDASSTTTTWLSPQMAAAASIVWKQATVYKMPLGKSQVDVRLNQSLVHLSSTGKQGIVDQLMGLQPVLDLRQAELLLKTGQGTLLDHWQITESDSRTWLKYAAPLLADATSASGQVSIEVTGSSVPIFDPATASARGTIHVHELTVGPGPLAQQLLPLIDQIRTILKPASASLQEKSTWLQLKPQSLPIVVDRGRVHHDGFEMGYGDLTIRTRGSVGFDQTLNMVAEIPILNAWINDDKILSHLSGKSISIPISGTLSKPTIDPRVVTQLTQQLLRDSARGLIDESVSKEVDKVKEKVGSAVGDELKQFQDKVNNKVQDKLQSGLKELLGGDGQK